MYRRLPSEYSANMGVSDTWLRQADVADVVHISGGSPLALDQETLRDFEATTETVTVVCASGDRHTAAWTGVPVHDLLEAARIPQSTTHVIVESRDDYRVAIPVREAIEGLLAFLKDGEPIGRDRPYSNRFVSPATEGARDIKGVRRIDHTSLGPGEDPEQLENLFPEGERFTAERFDDEDGHDEAQ